MNLYIQIVDDQPVNHPAFEDNLIQAFGSIPAGWEPFIRVERPQSIEIYKVVDSEPKYQKVDGTWQDVWNVRDMTDEEKAAIQQPVKDAWTKRPYASNFTAWVYDDATNSFKPPFPKPDDGKEYRWCGPETNWKEIVAKPDDGKQYLWDFDNWCWKEFAPPSEGQAT